MGHYDLQISDSRFQIFFILGLRFAEWESIDRGEIVDRMKVEREAMTRALAIVKGVHRVGVN